MESLNTLDGGQFEESSARDAKGMGKANGRSRESLSSVGSKIWYVVENKFPSSTFTSSDVQEMYEEEYKESMRLDAVATYLSRYFNKGKLIRNRKGGKEWVYKIVPTTKTTALTKNNKSEISQINNILSSTKQINVDENSTNSISQAPSDFSTLTEMN
jgi:hypothetical protein